MNLTMFIGSSTQALNEVDVIAPALEGYGITVIRWDDPEHFPPAEDTLSSLLRLSETVDAALFLFAADDAVTVRGQPGSQPRDNVLVEYGLFLGRLGKANVAFYRKNGAKTPSDVDGLTHIRAPEGFNNQARLQLRAWIQTLRRRDAACALESWMVPAIRLRQTFREDTVKGADGRPEKVRTSVDGPFLLDINDRGMRFFAIEQRSQYMMGEARALMLVLRKYVDPPDQYWQDLVEDQAVVYEKFLRGETAFANVGIRLNESHPYFADRIFAPLVIDRQTVLQADGFIREDSTAVYVDVARLPRHVFGEQIWKDVSRNIDLDTLAVELGAMADAMDVLKDKERMNKLRDAATALQHGGGPRVLELCAEVGLYSMLRTAKPRSTTERFLRRMGLNPAVKVEVAS
jgi:predicted nucleotide-binding protein with TIR-like domain